MGKLFVVVSLGLLCMAGVAHADMVLNITASQYGDVGCWPGTPTYDITVPAGDYSFKLVSPATNPQAVYWAWQPWSGIDNWHTVLAIFDGVNRYILGMNNALPTAQEAFWQSVNTGNGELILSFGAATTLHIGVSDNVIGDNGGGISLLVSPVPLPPSILVMVTGLFSCFLIRRHRRRM